jgi:hypothetical protein
LIKTSSSYTVIVRSSNRLKKYRYKNIWVQKWRTLKQITAKNCAHLGDSIIEQAKPMIEKFVNR